MTIQTYYAPFFSKEALHNVHNAVITMVTTFSKTFGHPVFRIGHQIVYHHQVFSYPRSFYPYLADLQ